MISKAYTLSLKKLQAEQQITYLSYIYWTTVFQEPKCINLLKTTGYEM
jgi:hypothetical protein